MRTDFDVFIIGSGVIGASIGRLLSRYRLRIALADKEVDASFGTSKANSGIIHAGFHSDPSMMKSSLCVRGNREFDRLAEELGFPFERRGELVVAFTPEEEQYLEFLYRQGLANNVRYMELIGRERLLEMEPHLNSDVLGALYAPTAGIIGSYEYCFALAENAAANGVELAFETKINAIIKKDAGFEIAAESGKVYSSEFVINAAGVFSDEIASLAGLHTFKILPRKGEEYLLDKRVGSLVKRVIFPVPSKTSKGILIIPTVDGPVMVGPTADDTTDKNECATSQEGLKRVFEYAQRMVPAIRASDVITSFAGLRPVAECDDFIIGQTRIPGFINAAGIQSPGLTASPAIAEYIRNVLCSQGLKLEVKPDWNPQRKASLRIRESIETRDLDRLVAIVNSDPAYAKLVCRCECITEAEIVSAIRRGHSTLDGIKFATRAGSGRCQGGFCTSRILRIISRETGIPIEKITKKGPGSEIVKYVLNKGVQ